MSDYVQKIIKALATIAVQIRSSTYLLMKLKDKKEQKDDNPGDSMMKMMKKMY